MAQAGSEGNVDEAQSMMKQVEQLRQEREVIKNSKNEDPANKVFLVSVLLYSPQKQLPENITRALYDN